jgi:predicted nucleic acid-binding protein
MLYLDTSVLVAALTRESHTPEVLLWLKAQRRGDFVISHWTLAEFSSALSLKIRTRHLDESQRAETLAVFATMVADSLTVLPVPASAFLAAGHYADQFALGLRAGDALHAAICGEAGAILCTLDRRLHQACGSLGIRSTLCAP